MPIEKELITGLPLAINVNDMSPMAKEALNKHFELLKEKPVSSFAGSISVIPSNSIEIEQAAEAYPFEDNDIIISISGKELTEKLREAYIKGYRSNEFDPYED